MTIDSSGKVWRPFVRSAAVEVDTKFPRPADTGTYVGHGEIFPKIRGEFNAGQYAVDFMINTKAQGDAIAEYLWNNRERLGLRYIIWWKRIRSRTQDGNWHEYVNPVPKRRGTPSGDHYNHVHASFFSNGHYVPLPDSPVIKDPRVTMYAKINTIGYKIVNGRGKINKRVSVGYKIVGKIKSRSDGKYLVTRFGNWYPLDDLTTEAPPVKIK